MFSLSETDSFDKNFGVVNSEIIRQLVANILQCGFTSGSISLLRVQASQDRLL